ncbi:MAG: thiol:disulfide interchange protein, partial [Chloroflexi bacterium]|nr:thiol:disulfide interchange protein [Chloroflexota bacterium]
GIPEKYFVDTQGQLSRKYIGPIQPKALRAIIADLIVN